MVVTYEAYWDTLSFRLNTYWSSTDNTTYPSQANFVTFTAGNHTLYSGGNVGYYNRNQYYSARCVRNNGAQQSMVTNAGGYAMIDFGVGMPAGSFITTSKGVALGNEHSTNNQTVYRRLRIANSNVKIDGTAGTENMTWANAQTACGSSREGTVTGR